MQPTLKSTALESALDSVVVFCFELLKAIEIFVQVNIYVKSQSERGIGAKFLWLMKCELEGNTYP